MTRKFIQNIIDDCIITESESKSESKKEIFLRTVFEVFEEAKANGFSKGDCEKVTAHCLQAVFPKEYEVSYNKCLEKVDKR